MTEKEYKSLVDGALSRCFLTEEDYPVKGLAEAMRYSLLAGGKRIRPMLVLEFCRVSGGDPDAALSVACAIEMLHTYSLIHDDLPCMDNDSLRRGMPTNHVVYGECTATLAGDALQAEAFGTILRSRLPAERRARCAMHLANAVGLDGMCGGQYLDMLGEGKILTAAELDEINTRKTGALLTAACLMGVAAAGGSPEQEEAAARYGAALGAAFQIRDDMLDVLSTEAELGKPIGSDREEQKNTYMALYGAEKCAGMIDRLTAAAKDALDGQFADTGLLCALADSLAHRRT
jgi:geranylgeranyl diphosphate synthase type II